MDIENYSNVKGDAFIMIINGDVFKKDIDRKDIVRVRRNAYCIKIPFFFFITEALRITK